MAQKKEIKEKKQQNEIKRKKHCALYGRVGVVNGPAFWWSSVKSIIEYEGKKEAGGSSWVVGACVTK